MSPSIFLRAPRRQVRLLFVAVAAVLFLLCLCDGAHAAVEGPRMSPVVQCGEDFHTVCNAATSARELWGCMMKNVEKISNGVCRDYVAGFRACTRDAEKKGSCVNPAADYATSVRRCLRSMPEASISADCLESRFYFPIAEARHTSW